MKPKANPLGHDSVGHHFARFNTVGAIGIAVQLAVLAVLRGGLRLNYLLATALAVESAVLHNFVWHERWTWADRARVSPGDVVGRLIRFNLTSGALSILGNLVFMRLLAGQIHVHYLLANLITIAACSLINFVVSDRFIFQPYQLTTKPQKHDRRN